jgi:transposase
MIALPIGVRVWLAAGYTVDVVPRQWFVTEHVREKFSCRSCETITQPPAPFHRIPRGFAGPSLLAMTRPGVDGRGA